MMISPGNLPRKKGIFNLDTIIRPIPNKVITAPIIKILLFLTIS